jgi:hypothetical protein
VVRDRGCRHVRLRGFRADGATLVDALGLPSRERVAEAGAEDEAAGAAARPQQIDDTGAALEVGDGQPGRAARGHPAPVLQAR